MSGSNKKEQKKGVDGLLMGEMAAGPTYTTSGPAEEFAGVLFGFLAVLNQLFKIS